MPSHWKWVWSLLWGGTNVQAARRITLLPPRNSGFVPDVPEQEGGLCGVLNSAKRQQDRVGHLQGVAWNGGTERHAEAAVLALKFNVVFILTLAAAAITPGTGGRDREHTTNTHLMRFTPQVINADSVNSYLVLQKVFFNRLGSFTFSCGLKVICIEKDVPGLIRIDRGIKVLKTLEAGGLREVKRERERGRER